MVAPSSLALPEEHSLPLVVEISAFVHKLEIGLDEFDLAPDPGVSQLVQLLNAHDLRRRGIDSAGVRGRCDRAGPTDEFSHGPKRGAVFEIVLDELRFPKVVMRSRPTNSPYDTLKARRIRITPS